MECRSCYWWDATDEEREAAKDETQAICMFSAPTAAIVPIQDPLGRPSAQVLSYRPSSAAAAKCRDYLWAGTKDETVEH